MPDKPFTPIHVTLRQRCLWSLLGVLLFLTACQPAAADVQATINAQAALAVAATQAAWPTATPYATATSLPTQPPWSTATPFPEQTPLPTATEYPTATPYPTSTPAPTNTPTPVPPTAPPAVGASAPSAPASGSAPASPLQIQAALLDKMTLQQNLLVEFQGLVGSLTTQPTTDCNRLIQIYGLVQGLPVMDVTGAEATVQQAYAAYRSAIEHFTRPETTPGDIVALCQTQPENLSNIPNMQVNAIVLYVGQSIALMRNAWYAIGGR
jgi:hypothetical protein